jgi:hypothetical protein
MDIVHGRVVDNELPAIGANAAHNGGRKYGSDDADHTTVLDIRDVLP